MNENPDPVLEVTGVPAAVILERCNAVREMRRSAPGNPTVATRSGPALPPGGAMPIAPSGQKAWRLADFADLRTGEFVMAAHLILLGRAPYPEEMTRRTRELAAGRTRLELIARLLCSPEGRTVRERDLGGVGLPLLAGLGRALDRVAVRGQDRASLNTDDEAANGSRNPSKVADWLSGLRHLGELRREVVALRKEVQDLRKGLER